MILAVSDLYASFLCFHDTKVSAASYPMVSGLSKFRYVVYQSSECLNTTHQRNGGQKTAHTGVFITGTMLRCYRRSAESVGTVSSLVPLSDSLKTFEIMVVFLEPATDIHTLFGLVALRPVGFRGPAAYLSSLERNSRNVSRRAMLHFADGFPGCIKKANAPFYGMSRMHCLPTANTLRTGRM